MRVCKNGKSETFHMDGKALKNLIKSERYSCRSLSEKIGFNSTYLAACIRENKIGKIAVEKLKAYNIKPEKYQVENYDILKKKFEQMKKSCKIERLEDPENVKECPYCDAEEDKDIFFNWLPAMFGLEKEDHDYNPDVTVFITDDNELELCVMMGDDYLVKEKKKILFCPFCGRRLRND